MKSPRITYTFFLLLIGILSLILINVEFISNLSTPINVIEKDYSLAKDTIYLNIFNVSQDGACTTLIRYINAKYPL